MPIIDEEHIESTDEGDTVQYHEAGNPLESTDATVEAVISKSGRVDLSVDGETVEAVPHESHPSTGAGAAARAFWSRPEGGEE